MQLSCNFFLLKLKIEGASLLVSNKMLTTLVGGIHMKNKIVMTLASLAFASVAVAGEDGFRISGDIAASVFTESGKGANQFPGAGGAIGAGENNGDFSVDMVELQLDKTMGNSGFVVGIGYGRLFEGINNTIDSNTAGPRSTLNLTNAYFHHKFGETGLALKVGRFAANLGFESYNYMNNMNYGRSYGFYLLNPFFFTGAALDYNVNDMVSVGVVVANTNENSDIDENESKVMGVNATIKPMEGLTLKVNYLSGRDGSTDSVAPATPGDYVDTTRINVAATYALNSMYDFGLAYNSLTTEDASDAVVIEEQTATSIALYAGAKMETWGAGLRYEMFDDGDGMFTVADNAHDIITLTGWYNLDQNAVLKLEIAQTSADKPELVDDNFAADDSMMSYGLGLMYRF
jgi:hypothetical protein